MEKTAKIKYGVAIAVSAVILGVLILVLTRPHIVFGQYSYGGAIQFESESMLRNFDKLSAGLDEEFRAFAKKNLEKAGYDIKVLTPENFTMKLHAKQGSSMIFISYKLPRYSLRYYSLNGFTTYNTPDDFDNFPEISKEIEDKNDKIDEVIKASFEEYAKSFEKK